ncbi:MAG: hypothetical protein JST40_01840 [Armatimonadetes bacterium]|nr:hypothetical protein [Armatimonadota bacterium]
MRKWWWLGALIVAGGCGGGSVQQSIQEQLEDPIAEATTTWRSTMGQYTLDPLWVKRDAADASEYLMVPLHAAYVLDAAEWKADLRDLLARFAAEPDPFSGVPELNQLEFLQVCSRFMVLSAQSGEDPSLARSLEPRLSSAVRFIWQEEPAWLWDHPSFSGGMREKILWKLGQSATSVSYYRAISDDELFLMSIAADLRAYARITGRLPNEAALLEDVADLTHQVMTQRGEETPDGGWLFDTGAWDDHRDYAYSGHLAKDANLAPLKHSNSAWDSSHFHRMPIWLYSFELGAPPASAERTEYRRMRTLLANQFLAKVVTAPTADFRGIRFTNYVDGYNGLYRWGYETQKNGGGFGPFELSGTPFLGWYSFLGPSVAAVYTQMYHSFPMNDDMLALYVDRTSRVRNPLVTEPGAWSNGMRLLTTQLAVQVAKRIEIQGAASR